MKKIYIITFCSLVILAGILFKVMSKPSGICFYKINNGEVYTKYTNGTIGDEELMTYFEHSKNDLIMCLTRGDIQKMVLTKRKQKYATNAVYDLDVTLAQTGTKKIDEINAKYMNTVIMMAFDSQLIGSFKVMEKIKDVVSITSGSIGSVENVNFLKKMYPNLEEK